MARLIDADALGIGKAKREAFTVPEYADGWNAAIDIIATAPTIDRPTRSQFKRMAVQLGYESVIHCRECRKMKTYECPMYSANSYDDFCSYGERRTDEQ